MYFHEPTGGHILVPLVPATGWSLKPRPFHGDLHVTIFNFIGNCFQSKFCHEKTGPRVFVTERTGPRDLKFSSLLIADH